MIYAVNKRTKTYHVIGVEEINTSTWPLKNYLIVEADADGWIEWKGGECPMPDDQDCEYLFHIYHGNKSLAQIKKAVYLKWSIAGHSDSVTHYRPILNAEEKDVKKEWSGEGLPPVGEEVEVRRNDNDWLEVVVVSHDDGGIIYRDPATTDHRYKWAIGGGIRPIRTDRDRWIEAAMGIYKANDSVSVPDAIGDIYDAGLAKLPEQTK